MTTTPAAERLNRAALMLATAVDVQDRINDPDYPADRSARAERLRAAHFAEDLREFRAALTALHGIL